MGRVLIHLVMLFKKIGMWTLSLNSSTPQVCDIKYYIIYIPLFYIKYHREICDMFLCEVYLPIQPSTITPESLQVKTYTQ